MPPGNYRINPVLLDVRLVDVKFAEGNAKSKTINAEVDATVRRCCWAI
jgi:hypothetical protein